MACRTPGAVHRQARCDEQRPFGRWYAIRVAWAAEKHMPNVSEAAHPLVHGAKACKGYMPQTCQALRLAA